MTVPDRAFLGGVGWVIVQREGDLCRIEGDEALYRRDAANMLHPVTKHNHPTHRKIQEPRL